MNHVTHEVRDTAAASVQGKGRDCIVERATTNWKPHVGSREPEGEIVPPRKCRRYRLRNLRERSKWLRLEIGEKRHNYDTLLDNIDVQRSDAGEIFPSTLTEVAHIRVATSIYGPFFQTLRTALPKNGLSTGTCLFSFLFSFSSTWSESSRDRLTYQFWIESLYSVRAFPLARALCDFHWKKRTRFLRFSSVEIVQKNARSACRRTWKLEYFRF